VEDSEEEKEATEEKEKFMYDGVEGEEN